MMLFQPPATTRYDLNFTLIGIPVRVHPLFWLMALILGGMSGDLIQIVIWVAVVFVSILIHEMGHALVMRRYGQEAEVILYLGGGLAVPRMDRFSFRQVRLTVGQRILISLAGPGAGFLFAALIAVIVKILGGTVVYSPILGIIPAVMAYLPTNNVILYAIISALLWINIFWGVINLMPVQPLDGGNVAREYLSYTDPVNGARQALWISVIVGGLLAIVGLLVLRSVYMALLFGWLAFQSYEQVGGRFRRY